MEFRETLIHEMIQHYFDEVADNADGNRKQNRLIGMFWQNLNFS